MKVVTPGVWLFHKGLTFTQRRTGSSKYYKDLYGIWYLCNKLGKVSECALDELHTLKQQRPSWARRFNENLEQFIANASPADWRYLRAQDIQGRLTKTSFMKTIQAL